VVVSCKAEREHGAPGFVGHIHSPLAAIPDRMAVEPDHLASGCDRLMASFRDPGQFNAVRVPNAPAVVNVKEVARQMALPALRREHTYLSGTDA